MSDEAIQSLLSMDVNAGLPRRYFTAAQFAWVHRTQFACLPARTPIFVSRPRSQFVTLEKKSTKQLNNQEVTALRCHFGTLKLLGRGQHRKYQPYVFTEHGVAMLSSVLKNDRAVEVNIEIIPKRKIGF